MLLAVANTVFLTDFSQNPLFKGKKRAKVPLFILKIP